MDPNGNRQHLGLQELRDAVVRFLELAIGFENYVKGKARGEPYNTAHDEYRAITDKSLRAVVERINRTWEAREEKWRTYRWTNLIDWLADRLVATKGDDWTDRLRRRVADDLCEEYGRLYGEDAPRDRVHVAFREVDYAFVWPTDCEGHTGPIESAGKIIRKIQRGSSSSKKRALLQSDDAPVTTRRMAIRPRMFRPTSGPVRHLIEDSRDHLLTYLAETLGIPVEIEVVEGEPGDSIGFRVRSKPLREPQRTKPRRSRRSKMAKLRH